MRPGRGGGPDAGAGPFLAFVRFGGHVVMVDLTPSGRIVPTSSFLDVVDEAASRAEAALG